MVLKDWDDVPYGAADCVRDHVEWNAMIDYIKHSGSCSDDGGFTLYDDDASTTIWFEFYENSIDFLEDRAIYINDDETYIGHGAGDSVTTAVHNTLVGHDAGNALVDGSANSAFGYESLFVNTGGGYNAAFGSNALHDNTVGNFNTAIGVNALATVDTGDNNTAVGYLAGGLTNIDTNKCVFIGQEAGENNTQDEIVALGYKALESNTGVENTALGSYSLDAAVTGQSNTAVGFNSLSANTSGADNTAAGAGCLIANTTGAQNTGVGRYAFRLNTEGTYNCAFGKDAMRNNLTGDYNAAMGSLGLYTNSTGNNNTAMGYDAGGNTATDLDGCVYVGYQAGRTNAASNRLYISNNAALFPLIYGEFDTDIIEFGNGSDEFFLKFSHDANDSIIETPSDDRSIFLKPHGTGLVKFGLYEVKAAEAFAGFITMEDEGGTPRKVMICA